MLSWLGLYNNVVDNDVNDKNDVNHVDNDVVTNKVNKEKEEIHQVPQASQIPLAPEWDASKTIPYAHADCEYNGNIVLKYDLNNLSDYSLCNALNNVEVNYKDLIKIWWEKKTNNNIKIKKRLIDYELYILHFLRMISKFYYESQKPNEDNNDPFHKFLNFGNFGNSKYSFTINFTYKFGYSISKDYFDHKDEYKQHIAKVTNNTKKQFEYESLMEMYVRFINDMILFRLKYHDKMNNPNEHSDLKENENFIIECCELFINCATYMLKFDIFKKTLTFSERKKFDTEISNNPYLKKSNFNLSPSISINSALKI